MAHEREIALSCVINAGGFSGERIVSVTRADGEEQKVLSPRHYCWTKDGQPLAPEQPRLGLPIEGLVAARRLDVFESGVVVTTPDGEVFVVSLDIVKARPAKSEITHNVPV